MSKKNLTRKDLAKRINKNLGFSVNFSLTLIDDFFDFLGNELINSKKVKITSFGTFKVRKKKERIGRNPKTKIEAKITPRKVITFSPSLKIKKKINR